MTTLDLKNILVQQIQAIQDESFLNEIKKIIDAKTKSIEYETSDEQKESIYKSIYELEQGLGIKDNVVHEDVQKWLKKK